MFTLTMDSRELRKMVNWLGKFDVVARDPRTMSAGVRPIGAGMLRQFNSEGGYFGGHWQHLSAMTQDVRAERGYNPEHPILVQSEDLKRVTAETLAAYHTGTTSVTASGAGITMVATSTPLQFEAKAAGAKMQNHFGGKASKAFIAANRSSLGRRNPGRIPARPFFGFVQKDVDKAFTAIVNRLMTDWARRTPSARKI